MLIALRPEKGDALERLIREAGIRLSRVGEIKDAAEGIVMVSGNGAVAEIRSPGSDEIYAVKGHRGDQMNHENQGNRGNHMYRGNYMDRGNRGKQGKPRESSEPGESGNQ
jgi:hypothetical protein